jgi:hypothetical protein
LVEPDEDEDVEDDFSDDEVEDDDFSEVDEAVVAVVEDSAGTFSAAGLSGPERESVR